VSATRPTVRVVGRFRLRVEAGPDAGLEWTSAGGRAVLGTEPSAHVTLKDRTVSRFHCEIVLGDDGPVVRDLGSRNGTLVQGVNVLAARLAPGALLTLGDTRVRFEPSTERAEVPLSARDHFGLLLGRSLDMRTVFAQLERAAGADSTVLLEGETGTGKEAAAESIHRQSARRDGPWVVVDCTALPAELLGSELFGHERGAFTGAETTRQGAFEVASGGTIFLDEIGELDLELQPQLLRVLERREIKRVGATRPIPVDVRVIAAGQRDLRADVNARRFRADLFYRLAVIEVKLPPLRARADDLAMLVEHFLDRMRVPAGPERDALTSATFLERLARHRWPGNVRELRNTLERCLAMQGEPGLPPPPERTDPPTIRGDEPLRTARDRWVEFFERRYLRDLLDRAGGNVSAAALTAGVDRAYLYRMLWRNGLR
jgi:transcriptional regulator with PAS, ATPase and Fis domain